MQFGIDLVGELVLSLIDLVLGTVLAKQVGDRDLLLIAGSDRGKLQLRREPIQASELLDSVRNRFAWRATESERQLEVHAPTDLTINGDRLRLEQAVGNLVEPSDTAMEPSGSRPTPITERPSCTSATRGSDCPGTSFLVHSTASPAPTGTRRRRTRTSDRSRA